MNTPVEETQEYNSRYVCFANSLGMAVEEVIEHNRKVNEGLIPGNQRHFFSLWIQNQWNTWYAESRAGKGHYPKSRWNAILGEKDHAEFDAWLESKFPSK